MSSLSPRPNPFGLVAIACLVLLVVGSGIYWGVALTFGLVSGLVVVMAPAYPLFVQALLTTLVASLCLWRGRPWLAVFTGLTLIVVPQALVVGWYAWENLECSRSADPTACFAYLNGSPLLPIGVGASVCFGVGEAGVLCVAVWAARRMFGDPALPS